MRKILDKDKSKKAQIGETLTWIVATFIIIGILVVFIFFSISLSKIKEITFKKADSSILKPSSKEGWIGVKNSIAFSLNDKDKNKIEEWLNENT